MPKGLIRHVFVTKVNPGSFRAGPLQLLLFLALAMQLAAADAGVSACAASGLLPVQLRSLLPLLARAVTPTCR